MKTVEQILTEVRTHKTCSKGMLYVYFKRLSILPIGANQRPQRYPDDATARILTHLGLEHVLAVSPCQAMDVPICGMPAAEARAALARIESQRSGRIVTMAELRRERAKARKARRAA